MSEREYRRFTAEHKIETLREGVRQSMLRVRGSARGARNDLRIHTALSEDRLSRAGLDDCRCAGCPRRGKHGLRVLSGIDLLSRCKRWRPPAGMQLPADSPESAVTYGRDVCLVGRSLVLPAERR